MASVIICYEFVCMYTCMCVWCIRSTLGMCMQAWVSLGHAPPQGWPDEPRVKKRTSVASKLTLRIPVSIFRELEWEIGAVVVLYPPSFYVKVENLNSSSCLYSKHFIHFICFPSPINDVSVDAHRNYISYIG